MENITSELLKIIHIRAKEFAYTKYGKEPDCIIFDDYGQLEAKFSIHNRGEYDYEYETINAEDLTLDLELVAKEREIKLEEQRKKQEEWNKKRKLQLDIEEKERRRIQYNNLKKEFGV